MRTSKLYRAQAIMPVRTGMADTGCVFFGIKGYQQNAYLSQISQTGSNNIFGGIGEICKKY